MGFMKPTTGNPPKPTDARQERGKIVNPPVYLEMGGLKGPSKVNKASRMRVDRPESGTGPYSKKG